MTFHGCLLELRERKEAYDSVNQNDAGNVVWFRAYPITDNAGSLPKSWFSTDEKGEKYWSIQGNGRAQWSRRLRAKGANDGT